MKKLPDRIAALEAAGPPAIKYDLSGVPTFILEKLAAADPNKSLAAALNADEVAVLAATLA